MENDINDNVLKAVYSAIDEINQMLPEEKKVTKSRDVELLGASAAMDSLSLVNFIVEIEQKIYEIFNVKINLAEPRSEPQQQSPLKSIGALVNYISYQIVHNR